MSTDRSEQPVRTRRAPCPKCNKDQRDTALSISTFPDGREVSYCHRCGFKTVRRPHTTAHDWNRDRDRAPVTHFREAPPAHTGLSDYGICLFNSTLPIEPSTTAANYLQARGLVLPPKNSDLRWLPRLRHPIEGFEGPALIAMVRSVTSGKAMTLHRTWINPDGSKRGNPPRLLLGGHSKIGGAIMLWYSAEAPTGELGIAEGIETALAVAHSFRPMWSTVDAGNLVKFPVLQTVDRLNVFADNDAAGIEAARTCGLRWDAAGKKVRILTPRTPGHDFADEIRRKGVAA